MCVGIQRLTLTLHAGFHQQISHKRSVEYPVLLADAEVYWMEFEVAWKTYFEEVLGNFNNEI
jgi:hypothetical protein